MAQPNAFIITYGGVAMPRDLVRPYDLQFSPALELCRGTSDINDIIELTRHPEAGIRQRAIETQEKWPDRSKRDVVEFWTRLLELVDDEWDFVRFAVLQTLSTGPPAHLHLEGEVAVALERLKHDPKPYIGRHAAKTLDFYRRSKRHDKKP